MRALPLEEFEDLVEGVGDQALEDREGERPHQEVGSGRPSS